MVQQRNKIDFDQRYNRIIFGSTTSQNNIGSTTSQQISYIVLLPLWEIPSIVPWLFANFALPQAVCRIRFIHVTVNSVTHSPAWFCAFSSRIWGPVRPLNCLMTATNSIRMHLGTPCVPESFGSVEPSYIMPTIVAAQLLACGRNMGIGDVL